MKTTARSKHPVQQLLEDLGVDLEYVREGQDVRAQVPRAELGVLLAELATARSALRGGFTFVASVSRHGASTLVTFAGVPFAP